MGATPPDPHHPIENSWLRHCSRHIQPILSFIIFCYLIILSIWKNNVEEQSGSFYDGVTRKKLAINCVNDSEKTNQFSVKEKYKITRLIIIDSSTFSIWNA